MANSDQCCKDKNNPQMITLPEEIIYEIFSYLSFETLHFYLSKVCIQMNHFVDHYAGAGGLFIIASRRNRNCKNNQLVDVIQKRNKTFRISWKTVPSTPNESCHQQSGTKRCRSLPYEEYFYFRTGDTIFCANYQRKKFLVYKYDVLSNNWDKLSKKCFILKCKSIEYPDKSECPNHPINLPEGVTYYYHEGFSYINVPFLRPSKNEINNGCICNYEAWFCTCFYDFKSPMELELLDHYSALRTGPQRLLFVGGIWTNRNKRAGRQSGKTVNLVEYPNSLHNYINPMGCHISWKSKYIDEMPYRPMPLCFKLKNNLYIAGHRTIAWFDCRLNDKERRLMCTNCGGFATEKGYEIIECRCCDKFDLSNEKYYRNICSLPRSIRNLANLKVASNKNGSLALIAFYDPEDCRDKIWIFTEKEEKFEEHWDPNSEPCLDCKEDPRNTNFFGDGFMMGHHRVHPSWKMKIMNIQ